MQDITLQALLEAGCHFGHKSERWHPKANKFIYTEKDGIHIIDLAKTKAGLEEAAQFVFDIASSGQEVLFVGTKRQASGVVKQEVEAVGAPYFVERWIGGFLTNWDQIKKNIDKILSMEASRAIGGWKKFPKHEQVKMARYLDRIKVYYGGVLSIKQVPGAIVVVDIKKEIAAVREAQRRGVPLVGIVDTNSDPTGIEHVIPANDDAVGSIQYLVHVLAEAYKEGREIAVKRETENKAALEAKKQADAKKAEPVKEVKAEPKAEVKEEKKVEAVKEEKPKKAKKTE